MNQISRCTAQTGLVPISSTCLAEIQRLHVSIIREDGNLEAFMDYGQKDGHVAVASGTKKDAPPVPTKVFPSNL